MICSKLGVKVALNICLKKSQIVVCAMWLSSVVQALVVDGPSVMLIHICIHSCLLTLGVLAIRCF